MGNIACCTSSDDVAVANPNTKGSYSQQQLLKDVDSLFKKYDVNKNGYLQEKEIKQIIGSALEEAGATRGANDNEVKILIKKSDKDRDGKISRDELLRLFTILATSKKK